MRGPLILAATLGLLTTAGCGRKEADPPHPVQELAAEERSDVAKTVMRAHFEDALLLKEAVINGDPETMRAPAQALLQRFPDMNVLPEGWRPWVERMRPAAERAARSYDATATASAVAEIAQICGECHAATGGGPKDLEEDPLPSGRDEISRHMLRHKWAADQMWKGLIAPSDKLWARGAGMMAEEPLHGAGGDLPADELAALQALAKNAHDLAGEAASTPKEQRGTIYGSFLSMCAECHHRLAAASSKQ